MATTSIALAALDPPKYSKENVFANSIAVNKHGLIVALSFDHQLHFSFSRKKAEFEQLKFTENATEFAEYCFRNISFSRDGRLLVVWSERNIGIVEIPLVINAQDKLFACKFYNIAVEFFGKNAETKLRIQKAAFHSLHDHNVIILCDSGSLILFDLISFNGRRIPLGIDKQFVSFCFGPRVDWLVASLLLVDVDGDVYALCPVLPTGSLVPIDAVKDLLLWVEDQRDIKNASCASTKVNSASSHSDSVQQYLENAFGTDVVSVLFDDNHLRENSVARRDGTDRREVGGQGTDCVVGGCLAVRDELLAPLTGGGKIQFSLSVPKLQGPLRKRGGELFTGPDRVATDICAPGNDVTTSGAVPALLIAYSNGDVEAFFIGADETSLAEGQSLGPAWVNTLTTEETFSAGGVKNYPRPHRMTQETVPVPDLLLVESFSVKNLVSLSEKALEHWRDDHWTLSSDPVMANAVHITSSSICASFLLKISWLSELVQQESVASEHFERHATNRGDTKNNINDVVERNGEAAGMEATFRLNATRCIPVYFPLQFSGETRSKLSGSAVVYDSFLGHLGVYRPTEGPIVTVNLTIHTRLCDRESSITASPSARLRESNRESVGSIAAILSRRVESSQDVAISNLLESAAIGLSTMPTIPSALASLVPQSPSLLQDQDIDVSRLLMRVSEHLNETVCAKLYEVGRRLKYRMESIRDMHDAQRDLFKGCGAGRSGEGLVGLFEALSVLYEKSRARLEALVAKGEAQRDAAAAVLESAMYLRQMEITPAEKAYHRELTEAAEKAVLLEAGVSTLQATVQRAQVQAVRAAAPLVSVKYETAATATAVVKTVASDVDAELSQSLDLVKLTDNSNQPSRSTRLQQRNLTSLSQPLYSRWKNNLFGTPRSEAKSSPLTAGSLQGTRWSKGTSTVRGSSSGTGTPGQLQGLLARSHQELKALGIASPPSVTLDPDITSISHSPVAAAGTRPGAAVPSTPPGRSLVISDTDLDACERLQRNQSQILQSLLQKVKAMEEKIESLRRVTSQ